MNDRSAAGVAAIADIGAYMHGVGEAARSAARQLARADTHAKNRALERIAAALRRDAALLKSANALDIDAARAANHDAAFVDRLTLNERTIDAMARGLEE